MSEMAQTSEDEDKKIAPMKIDVDAVLRQRAQRYYPLLPRFVISWLERVICQDRLNELLSSNGDMTGVDFSRGVLRDLSIKYNVHGSLPSDDRRVIIVSNHPLGGLDGLVLSDMVASQYGGNKKMNFIVNDLLNFVTPLNDIFIGINKHGAQSRTAAATLDEAFNSDAPIVMFPAGMVSRKGDDGRIADLRWHKMVVGKAISSKRNIIPVYFSGENSQFFYKFARLRTHLGLKFNIEMIRLPREIFNREGATFDINIGSPIAWQSLKGGKDAQSEADHLREIVYSLRDMSTSDS